MSAIYPDFSDSTPNPVGAIMNVPISRDLLTPDMFIVGDDGSLKLDRAKLIELIKSNSGKPIDPQDLSTVTVGVSVGVG